MAKLDPTLPKSAKVIFSYDLDDRDQDLFAVKIPKGVEAMAEKYARKRLA